MIQPHVMGRLIRKFLLFVILVAAIAAVVWWRDQHNAAPQTPTIKATPSSSTASSFNKNQYSVNDPTSIWLVVNKGRVLPSDYTPASLVVPELSLRLSATSPEMHVRVEMAKALRAMSADAKKASLQFTLASGYRSYAEQAAVYNAEVNANGQAGADLESARPAHSEHQTGLAADLEPASRLCEVNACFADMPEGKWLAANSYKYGLIIRYTKDNQSLTGYKYEPWHMRYVGTDLAAQINKSGQTLEQFFGLPAYTDYSATSYQLEAGR